MSKIFEVGSKHKFKLIIAKNKKEAREKFHLWYKGEVIKYVKFIQIVNLQQTIKF